MRKVSVILTHHLNENEKYLKAAVESLKAQTVQPIVHVVSSAVDRPPVAGPDWECHVHHDTSLDNATKKVHYAVDNLIPPDHDIMLMSDDVVISPETIRNLIDGASTFGCIQNPLSNNEYGSRWTSPFVLKNSYDFDDISLTIAQISMGFFEPKKEYPKPPILFPVPWISFYCTYIPREVWNKVGRLDEILDCRGNDVDYCRRAILLGIPTFINTGGFALHFGSKTLPKVTKPEEYTKADEHFRNKWNNHGPNLQ